MNNTPRWSCQYPRCGAVVHLEGHTLCLSHYQVEKAAYERGTDDRTRQLKRQFHEEQGGRCNYCGKRFRLGKLVWEHLTPPNRGGSDAVPNLQLSCAPCNEKKNLRTDREFREDNRALLPQQPRTPASPPTSSERLRSVNWSRQFRR